MAYDDGYGRQQVQFQFPPFTGWVKRLVIINAAIFFGVFAVGFSGRAEHWLIHTFALVPPDWAGIPPVWQIVTSGFLHSPTNPMHLIGNMLMLYFFGSMVQSAVGERRFIAHYFGAMLTGAALHLILAPLMGWTNPALGASGAVMGMVVAAAVLAPQSLVILIVIPVRLWVLAAILVGVDAFYFLSELRNGVGTGVAHSVHLGGALYGFLVARKRWIYRDPLAVIERKRAVKEVQRKISDDARMDAIMAKISREGIGSLTRSERAFMQRQSERKRSG